MARRFQYGRDLYSLLHDGMVLAIVSAKIGDLQTPIEQSLLIHNLLETSPLKDLRDRKDQLSVNSKKLKETLGPRVKEINSSIKTLNKEIKGLDFKYLIPELELKNIIQVVEKRMATILEVDDAQNIGNDLFRKNLYEVFRKTNESIFNFLREIKKERFEESLEYLEEEYREGMRQALYVCSIGYYTTAVFIAGRTVEELINNYYKRLLKIGRLDKIDITSSKFTFENKINKLNSEKLITESTYHNLSNVRIDRNEFGHPSAKKLSKESAHLKIRVILSEIPEIQKRIKKLNTRDSSKLN